MRNHSIEEDRLNSLLYLGMDGKEPSRFQMIRYSTWRIYLYNQLQTIASDRESRKAQTSFINLFPTLMGTDDRRQFYTFLYNPTINKHQKYQRNMRSDNISHFVCRMLYCQEEYNHDKFVQMEKRILEIRLWRELPDNSHMHRVSFMIFMKKIFAFFKSTSYEDYHIPSSDWESLGQSISFMHPDYLERREEFAKLPFQMADLAIKRRRTFIHNGFVYANLEAMLDLILACYDSYLREKLFKIRPYVIDLLVEDVQNQFSSFLLKTIKQINQEGMDDTKMNGKFNLTIRNIDNLGAKFFPPCMHNLNQTLKVNRHLRHDGRRQLWGFFKACGMDVHENKEYFRKHLEGKVTASEMKTHMYNIEHAYGLQGKRKVEHAWLCRSIISGTAPKKGEHHGCPFYHWRTEELSDFLKKHYKVPGDKLKEIIRQKEDKHFQVACGRLFEYSEVNQHSGPIPAEITSKLGKAPHLFYEAAMQLRELKLKKDDKNNEAGKKDMVEEGLQKLAF